MQNMFLKASFLFIALSIFNLRVSFSQADEIFVNSISDQRIKSVQLYREGWNFSNPVIRLGSDEKLILKFDLLSGDPETYIYSFTHCDRNWKESSVFSSAYITGMPENQIEEYKPSFNTRIQYYNYSLVFPNDRVSLALSGNYIIKVWQADDPEKIILTRRFMVSEESAKISASVRRPTIPQLYETAQQVDLTVNYTGLKIPDPRKDLSVTILQNGQWGNAAVNLEPDIVSNSEIRYTTLSEKNVFAGRAEYRYFDVRSTRYLSEFVRQTDFVGDSYHVFLIPSENREGKPYFYWQDFNGRYYIAVQEGRNMDTDADYLRVYFTLPSMYEYREGKVYIYGALTDYTVNSDCEMMWDEGKRQYQGSLLLKQGWYNYEYIVRGKNTSKLEPGPYENNFYETENEYLILVYYRNPRDRYDRVVATAVVNSSGKKTAQLPL
jgi:hypothetical protein